MTDWSDQLKDKRKSHWEGVYSTKAAAEVSWFQPVPEKSLQLIRATGVGSADAILDAGGGASTLIDNLLDEGFTDVSVLDISARALEKSQSRLGEKAERVQWIEVDVTRFEPERHYDLWHDRAVFHFLTDSADRDRYINVLNDALREGGHLILATFGPAGPLECSGLEICRYDVHALEVLLGETFELIDHEIDDHETPWGSSQEFLYSRWQLRRC